MRIVRIPSSSIVSLLMIDVCFYSLLHSHGNRRYDRMCRFLYEIRNSVEDQRVLTFTFRLGMSHTPVLSGLRVAACMNRIYTVSTAADATCASCYGSCLTVTPTFLMAWLNCSCRARRTERP